MKVWYSIYLHRASTGSDLRVPICFSYPVDIDSLTAMGNLIQSQHPEFQILNATQITEKEAEAYINPTKV